MVTGAELFGGFFLSSKYSTDGSIQPGGGL